jgi:DNA-directed RNA polymerase subunit alpha
MTELKFQYFKSQVDEAGRITGGFILHSLKIGQGLTIGNTLRRVLLSNIEGTTITAIKIPEIKHEFSTISGLREDILELILNLKQVILKSNKDNVEGFVNVKGPGVITASCIKFPADVEIINPNQYIGTLSSNKTLKFELKANRGVGYELVKQTSYKDLNDFITIDAIFMPVLSVNCKIKQVGYKNPTESLLLEITTNGSISPEAALNQAALILTTWFSSLSNEKVTKEEPIVEETTKNEIVLIEELQLPARALNSLKRAGITSINELSLYSQEEILEIRNLGQKLAQKIVEALETKFNIKLPNTKK